MTPAESTPVADCVVLYFRIRCTIQHMSGGPEMSPGRVRLNQMASVELHGSMAPVRVAVSGPHATAQPTTVALEFQAA